MVFVTQKKINSYTKNLTKKKLGSSHKVMFFNKTNEVKFWLTIYSYFDVSMIMVIITKKNKYLKKSQKKLNKI